jgi:hypothetical protein
VLVENCLLKGSETTIDPVFEHWKRNRLRSHPWKLLRMVCNGYRGSFWKGKQISTNRTNHTTRYEIGGVKRVVCLHCRLATPCFHWQNGVPIKVLPPAKYQDDINLRLPDEIGALLEEEGAPALKFLCIEHWSEKHADPNPFFFWKCRLGDCSDGI